MPSAGNIARRASRGSTALPHRTQTFTTLIQNSRSQAGATAAWRCFLPRQTTRHAFFSSHPKTRPKSPTRRSIAVIALGAWLTYTLYPAGSLQRSNYSAKLSAQPPATPDQPASTADQTADQTAWPKFASSFEGLSIATPAETSKLADAVVGLILPEWSKSIPGYVRKLQRELNMAPGSLADEIWQEAYDPNIHPEIQYTAEVRVSDQLCDEEKTFLSRRKKVVAAALARYLGLEEEDVHPDDVPVIAMCGSGGGLRALVAGTGSFLSSAEDGLFDCTTYMSGVSGSCWLQSLYFSSIAERDLNRAIEHLKARLGVHIAYPPAAFASLTFAPTNKYLLSGVVEKMKGDPGAEFGLVDAYGLLLAARLLVPRGELGVDEKDFKLSSQQEYIRYGQNPLPIYTAVRHEIPRLDAPNSDPGTASEAEKAIAKKEAWFQWFEMTPYEFFCEEFGAGIPTWAMGRRFENGLDKPMEDGFRLPETRMTSLLGIWGSAFCATLSHYYREIRPLVKSLSGLQVVDELIWGHNDNLSKVHPIEPATLPNFVYGMQDKLPKTVPNTIYENEHIQLMDAGMSNNLPIYPLLRPGREVEIIVAFDASADIKTDNWLSVVEGYARQRGIKGWPVGAGWPNSNASASKTASELDEAQADSQAEANKKLAEAQTDQAARRNNIPANPPLGTNGAEAQKADEAARELGYCTVWVGRTEERSSEPPPPPVDDASSWRLTDPDAGIAVVYLPFLANSKVADVDPVGSDFMSTWNFVYEPAQIDQAVALARANYAEGRDQIRATVRAVYERKRKRRVEAEAAVKRERKRRLARLGQLGRLGEGDHFS
ncbi:acyl transferase/acyl hydrolase/lysophospholipase [Lasiosphaeris hirsuta]|uniref:Lysophospholipase n=1 Tax=Lasiosphaeris hirsuta TaxID=260670 RepID=A0AA40DY05_9PEZI|nr:acyl transferase/acyl hydrolase/lysophospholipase [Lasiosphaeris hirsuta]